MNLEQLMLHTEAIIFAADRAVNEREIADVLKDTHEDMTDEQLEKLPSALEGIIEKYNADYYPFEVKQSGGGYQFLSKSTFHPLIAKLNGAKFRKRLSAAAMETLAIIAYRQPSTKSEVEYIRGVNSDYSVQKLLDLELVTILGRKEEAVGKPLIYGTSNNFLDYLGINSVEELPKLNEISAFEEIIPTNAGEALPEDSEKKMVVNENGEIDEVDGNTEVANETQEGEQHNHDADNSHQEENEDDDQDADKEQ
jgi:segregation and condensation protein B